MRFFTAGESHGPQLTAIIEGLPAQMELTAEMINGELARRQGGHGRGRRMQIETDEVVISSGVRHGKTLGSPVTLTVVNDDWKHWTKIMGVEPLEEGMDPEDVKRQITRPRPGHADLVGGMKYGHRDLRNVLERSSARETTMRVAIGAVAKSFLEELGIHTVAHVHEIGGSTRRIQKHMKIFLWKNCDKSLKMIQFIVRILKHPRKWLQAIDDAKERGDTIGGVVEVIIEGCPPGIGSYVNLTANWMVSLQER